MPAEKEMEVTDGTYVLLAGNETDVCTVAVRKFFYFSGIEGFIFKGTCWGLDEIGYLNFFNHILKFK